jgi:hypothetical protein
VCAVQRTGGSPWVTPTKRIPVAPGVRPAGKGKVAASTETVETVPPEVDKTRASALSAPAVPAAESGDEDVSVALSVRRKRKQQQASAHLLASLVLLYQRDEINAEQWVEMFMYWG